jgi:putative membrane-bound dehydrogenase-like protein
MHRFLLYINSLFTYLHFGVRHSIFLVRYLHSPLHAFAYLIVPLILASCSTTSSPDEHAAEISLADLKVRDGYDVSLFASEPMFSNPTNIAIDARGRVWVCEAYNYRMQFNAKNPTREEGDRIMILEDTDADGIADVSKVFYQGTDINSALGICILGNKVIVSRSPNVFVFTDTNGDDVPDKKELLYTGIQGEQHDHGVHAFIFGHDGHLYFNMGNEGKCLLTAAKDTVVDIHGRKVVTDGKPFREGLALRADIDGSHVEVLGHNFRNPFELTLDPFGTVWQRDNDDDGNKGTRINYVMEQGNYGYSDEITGAGWSARRTNMEKEIPLRHWHLSDPGAVPNVLQTGAGSPSGVTVYEGNMLTGLYGQLVHAEPGHNVVRSYPMQEDGAGYKASIENILEGQKDQWFRPVDVAVGADGSLFVADWYDPGVGGHQVGDLNRGRIYRITKKITQRLGYLPLLPDLSTPESSIAALTNPNNDIRYQAWTALAAQGEKAAPALEKLWASTNARHRAQALWLLARLPKADTYIQQAAKDPDANLRILALRVAREQKKDIFPLAVALADDASAQVRREVALSIRGSHAPKAPDLWTKLALQYDGKDRWYLEALGIGAQGNEEKFFTTWKNTIGREWSSPAGSDIVWRSRSQAALPLLAELIKKADDKTMLRYYRAFDFHTGTQKQIILAQLATQTQGEKILYALKHMDAAQFKMTPPVKTALNKVLQEYKDKIEFVELVRSFNLRDRNADLLAMATHYPDSAAGREAAKVLIERDETDLFQKSFDERNKEQSVALVKALWPQMFRLKTIALMERVMLDTTQDVELRKLAVKTFGGPWECEDRLLELAKTNKIPRDLQTTAAGVLQSAWRGQLREEAAKYIKLPPSKNGGALPAISVLTDKSGDAGKGKEIFKTLCSTCHQVDKEGVNFGPDLSEIGGKLSPEGLYKAILFPDQGISFGFEGYKIQLKDGSSVFGRIASETEDKVDIQYMGNTQSIQKADITARTQVPGSMMPANLQSMMTEEELVDLVEYLKELKKAEITMK